MQGAACCLTVQQPKITNASPSAFVPAWLLSLYLPKRPDLSIMYHAYMYRCGALEKDDDVVGGTRDPQRVCGAVGGATVLSLWHGSVRACSGRPLHCALKLHDGSIEG
jgi:hypothetical protein